jgi:cytochrome P450
VLERGIEAFLLAVPTWPLLRLVGSASFRRSFPRIGGALIVVLPLYAVSIAVVTVYAPGALRVLALLVLGVVVFDRWRARPGYGRARRWPPGSLEILPVDTLLDSSFVSKQARRHGPVFKVGQLTPGFDAWYRRFLHPVVCIVGLREGLDVLRRHDDALTVPVTPFSRFIPGGFLRYMEEPRHARYRPFFQAAFSRTVVRECEPLIAVQVRRGLARMQEHSARAGAPGIAPGPPLHQIVFGTFFRLFFGIEPDTDVGTRLAALYPGIDHRKIGQTPADDVTRAMTEITTIVEAQRDRLTRDGDGGRSTPGCFLVALARSHPEALRDPAVIGNLVYLLHTTGVDVASLLEWIWKMLSDNPAWIAPLVAEDDRDGDEDTSREIPLARRVVMETLRLAQTEFMYRRVSRPIEIGDFVIPSGWLVRICTRESHRDGDVFRDPERFDPDRFLGRAFATTEFSPFGALRMACLGADLTLTVGRAFVSELVRGFDWTVAQDGPLEFRDWHWKPSSRFRVRVVARAGRS